MCPAAAPPTVRPGAVDVLVAVVTVGVLGAAVRTDVEDVGGPHGLAFAFCWLFGALLLLLRRRHPMALLVLTVAALAAYYLTGQTPIGLALPLAVPLYAVADAGRWRTAAAVAVAMLGGSLLGRMAEGDDVGRIVGYELASDVALMAAVVALGDAVRSRRQGREQEALRLAAAVAEEQRAAAATVERERLGLARDLHDVLGHTVAVVSVQASVAGEALDDGDTAAARAALGVIREVGDGAMRELRSTVALLRDPGTLPVTPTAGLADLQLLARRTTDSGLPTRLDVQGVDGALPAVVGTAVHRIAQEALTNALRHAGATRAEVTVRRTPGGVEVEVTDDGCGGRPGAPGHGVAGMRERAQLLGGDLAAGPLAAGGFRVRARLPADGPVAVPRP